MVFPWFSHGFPMAIDHKKTPLFWMKSPTPEKRLPRSLSKSPVVLHGPLTDLRGLGAGTSVTSGA